MDQERSLHFWQNEPNSGRGGEHQGHFDWDGDDFPEARPKQVRRCRLLTTRVVRWQCHEGLQARSEITCLGTTISIQTHYRVYGFFAFV
jgi:hypothetical protein